MSAIYQGEVIELTSSDLEILEQELNPADDFQSLIIAPLEAREDDLYSELEDYLLNLEKRWEEPVNGFTPEQEDMLWEESYRYDSDSDEQKENQYL